MLILMFLFLAVLDGCKLRCKTRPTCDADWIPIQRQLGVWCARIVYWTNDVQDCTGLGGRVSSIESLDEMNIYLKQLKSMGETYARVNTTVLPACYCGLAGDVCPNTDDCQPPSVWHWNDNFTVGNELMSRVEPYYNNSYGEFSITLTTENDDGLTDEQDIQTYVFVCGKEAIS